MRSYPRVVVRVLLGILGWLALATFPAAAQAPCGDRDAFIAYLASDYHEHVTARGLTADGNMVELLVSPEQTWTLLVTMPDGRTCAVGAGEAWQNVPPEVPEPGRPS